MQLVDPYVSFGGGGGSGPSGSVFHVSTTGNNANPGTLAQPWRTITYSVTQIAVGDTLTVHGGTFYEEDITISADGEADDPITIVAAEGETPIIDGSMSAYRTAGNSAWQNVSGNLWRTVSTVADPGPFGYTGRIDVGGTLYSLTSYRGTGFATGLQMLSATSDLYDDSAPYYMGPGIVYHTDNKIYIRLDPNSAAAEWNLTTPFNIADKDPRNHAIFIAPNNHAFDVAGDYIVIDGIDMHHQWASIVGHGTGAVFQNLELIPGRFGARVGGNEWTFDNVTIDFKRASWLARSDVKGAGTPGVNSRFAAIDWEETNDGTFTDGHIKGAFDGMLALADNTGITVLNSIFDGCMDDGFQVGVGVHDFEFGYNTVLGAGPSHDDTGTADTPATIYIHHNVFDNTNKIFWARKPTTGVAPSEGGDEGYHGAPVHSTHGVPEFRDPWKIYNNTYVALVAPGQQGIAHYLTFHDGEPLGQGVHEFYNNIINYAQNHYVYRWADAQAGNAIYDHNIYARPTGLTAWAIESVSTTGTSIGSTADFTSWRANMGGSTGYYAPGWDANSIYQTTAVPLNGSYQPAIGGPADGNGVDLSAKGWPGTTPGTDYIGAKEPV